jgi:predicted CopG family antitoxin
MLNTFHLDEIKITKKGYQQFLMTDLPSELERNKEEKKLFRDLLRNLTEKKENFGKYWEFDLEKVDYTPSIMR